MKNNIPSELEKQLEEMGEKSRNCNGVFIGQLQPLLWTIEGNRLVSYISSAVFYNENDWKKFYFHLGYLRDFFLYYDKELGKRWFSEGINIDFDNSHLKEDSIISLKLKEKFESLIKTLLNCASTKPSKIKINGKLFEPSNESSMPPSDYITRFIDYMNETLYPNIVNESKEKTCEVENENQDNEDEEQTNNPSKKKNVLKDKRDNNMFEMWEKREMDAKECTALKDDTSKIFENEMMEMFKKQEIIKAIESEEFYKKLWRQEAITFIQFITKEAVRYENDVLRGLIEENDTVYCDYISGYDEKGRKSQRTIELTPEFSRSSTEFDMNMFRKSFDIYLSVVRHVDHGKVIRINTHEVYLEYLMELINAAVIRPKMFINDKFYDAEDEIEVKAKRDTRIIFGMK